MIVNGSVAASVSCKVEDGADAFARSGPESPAHHLLPEGSAMRETVQDHAINAGDVVAFCKNSVITKNSSCPGCESLANLISFNKAH